MSTVLLPIGVETLLVRLPDLKFRLDAIGKGLILFLACTGLSLPLAFWFSGGAIGFQSLLRWLLLTQTALIYVLVRGGTPVRGGGVVRRLMPILLIAAVATAAYGIFDFFWPVPLAHPAADQFIWLPAAVIRRAQGVFYEASSFGNLCGFFLVMVSAASLARQERVVGFSRPCLLGFVALLSLAVFVAFSRSVWANVLVSLLVFCRVSREAKLKRGLSLTALAFPLALFALYAPDMWSYFLNARIGSLGQLLVDPNLASSYRWDTWIRVFSILRDYPQYWLLGVGYKTLPYARLFHDEIITDNGFLNLLLETGIVGLVGFVVFSLAIFRTFFRLARRDTGPVAFLSAFLFSFWCGEWAEMMAADAYTYWRNMIVFLALMAYTLNLAEKKGPLRPRPWMDTELNSPADEAKQ